jgi:tetratricopeptide (TPR) repeat protein
MQYLRRTRWTQQPLEDRMRSLKSGLVALIVSFGVSAGASAEDRRECEGHNHELRIPACTHLLSANPRDFIALANRGVSYRIAGDYNRALPDIEAALRMRPHYAGLYLERGRIFAGKGQNASAIRDFDEALRRDASLISAYFVRAMAYEDTGQPERAKADLSAALDRDVRMVAALYMDRAYTLTRARDYDKAIVSFDKSIEIYPNWPSAFFGRGQAYEAKGNRQLAVADYRKTVQFHAISESDRQKQQSAREQLAKLSRE